MRCAHNSTENATLHVQELLRESFKLFLTQSYSSTHQCLPRLEKCLNVWAVALLYMWLMYLKQHSCKTCNRTTPLNALS